MTTSFSRVAEPEGFLRSSAELGLRYRSRDLAKIGQLVLGRDEWDGRRIVSAHWIDESIAAQIGVPDRLYFYGYQWWLGRSLVKGREIGIWVMAPDGRRIGVIRWPEQAVNFAFGGPDLRTLFCCAHTSVYTLRVKVPGNSHPWYKRREQ